MFIYYILEIYWVNIFKYDIWNLYLKYYNEREGIFMSDNVNIYMDNLLEVYTDLQDIVVNPITPIPTIRKDLQEYFDTMIHNVTEIDKEYIKEPDNAIILKMCCILGGIRMTACNRFGTFINVMDEDSDELVHTKQQLARLLLRYETRISEIISNYYTIINRANE